MEEDNNTKISNGINKKMEKDKIQFDDFTKLDIRIGTITDVEKVKNTDKLLKFMVEIGEEQERQILSGIAEYFPEPEVLLGKQVPVLVNLAPRTIRGHESQGMILYIVEDDLIMTLEPSEKNVPPGTPVK